MSRKLTIEEMQKIAKERGGKCLSTTYINYKIKLKWECSERHIWHATPDSIRNKGSWCPKCIGRNITIEEIKEYAKKKNGNCLSVSYKGSYQPLTWKCDKGHIWKSSRNNVINKNSWCPKCAGNERLTIEDARQIAKKRNGKCLSNQYINAKNKLLWQCREGHRFRSKYNNVKTGQWCPYCIKDGHVREEICRSVFQQLFKKKFPRTKPAWLLNSRGNLMELDGFNEKSKIAFEHHGIHHFETGRAYFVKNTEELKIRKQDDKRKKYLCKKMGIELFVIDYKQDLLSLPKIIEKEFLKRKINSYQINFNKKINIDDMYFVENKIQEMKKIAEKRGGKCLSSIYFDTNTKLEWECSKKHTWFAVPSSVKNASTWCPYCAGRPILDIQEMKRNASQRGGKCLSGKYFNAKTKLKWECSKKHIWHATPDSIRNKRSWCPDCYKDKHEKETTHSE